MDVDKGDNPRVLKFIIGPMEWNGDVQNGQQVQVPGVQQTSPASSWTCPFEPRTISEVEPCPDGWTEAWTESEIIEIEFLSTIGICFNYD